MVVLWKGKEKAVRSTVRSKLWGPRGEEGCPIRRLRERRGVSPLERGGDLDVADFLSGSQQEGIKRSQKSKIVYKASCWDCDAFYIGKAKRRLQDGKTEHFKALTQVGHASAVADHSTSTGHNIKWDHFEILASEQWDLQCKIKETLLIRDLKPALNENVGSEKLFLY